MKEIIFNLHGVGDPPIETPSAELKYWLDSATFIELLDEIRIAKESCQASVSITFDDGNMSDALVALPALVSRGLSARFCVCAARIGQSRYLDRVAIGEMIAAGMIVGSHGSKHVDWRQASESELDEEVSVARRRIEDTCGRRIEEVAIPFGSYNRRIISRLRNESFRTVFTSDGGVAQSGDWQKARNTLDRNRHQRDFVKAIQLAETPVRLLRRSIAVFYKSWR